MCLYVSKQTVNRYSLSLRVVAVVAVVVVVLVVVVKCSDGACSMTLVFALIVILFSSVSFEKCCLPTFLAPNVFQVAK